MIIKGIEIQCYMRASFGLGFDLYAHDVEGPDNVHLPERMSQEYFLDIYLGPWTIELGPTQTRFYNRPPDTLVYEDESRKIWVDPYEFYKR